MKQLEAAAAVCARIAQPLPGLPLLAAVVLVWRRSFLDRPRKQGGRLHHEFSAYHFPGGARAVLTDAQLTEFQFKSK